MNTNTILEINSTDINSIDVISPSLYNQPELTDDIYEDDVTTDNKEVTSLIDIFWDLKLNEHIGDKKIYFNNVRSKLKYLLNNFPISHTKYYFAVPSIVIQDKQDSTVEMVIKIYNTDIWELLDLQFELRYGNTTTKGVNIYSHQVDGFYITSIKPINTELYQIILDYRKDIAETNNYYMPVSNLTYKVMEDYKKKANINIFEVEYHAFYSKEKKGYFFFYERDYKLCQEYIANYISDLEQAINIANDLLTNPQLDILLDYIDVDGLTNFINSNT